MLAEGDGGGPGREVILGLLLFLLPCSLDDDVKLAVRLVKVTFENKKKKEEEIDNMRQQSFIYFLLILNVTHTWSLYDKYLIFLVSMLFFFKIFI